MGCQRRLRGRRRRSRVRGGSTHTHTDAHTRTLIHTAHCTRAHFHRLPQVPRRGRRRPSARFFSTPSPLPPPAPPRPVALAAPATRVTRGRRCRRPPLPRPPPLQPTRMTTRCGTAYAHTFTHTHGNIPPPLNTYTIPPTPRPQDKIEGHRDELDWLGGP